MTAHLAASAEPTVWYSEEEVLDEPPGPPGAIVGREAHLARLATIKDAGPAVATGTSRATGIIWLSEAASAADDDFDAAPEACTPSRL